MEDGVPSRKVQEPLINESPPPSQDNEEPDSQNETKLRATIAERMKGETVCCTNEDFMAHYLPPLPATVSLDAIVSDVEKSGYLHKSTAHAQDPLSYASVRPSQFQDDSGKGTGVDERMVLARLVDVVTAIQNSEAGAASNAFKLQILPSKGFQSDLIRECTFRIDAFTTASKEPPGAIGLTDIVNRLQLVSAIVHIMNEDIRRNFAFGITIEDDRVSMWYFSRTHSVKATSFSYAKNPRRLIHVLTALCCATEAQLGYDPRITLLPDKSYLYEFPITKEDKPTSIHYAEKESMADSAAPSIKCDAIPMPDALYFRTNASLSEVRAFRVAGRTTRILKGKQVVSKANPTPVPGAVDVVVKDVWIAADSLTEVQIQEQLFEDIERFATPPDDWKNHPLLEYFTEEDRAVLGAWLPNAGYKGLFLCADRENVGENNAVVHPRAWDSNDIFHEVVVTQDAAYIGSTRMASSLPVTSAPRPIPEADNASHRRAFSPKRRCFYLFRDVCTHVSALPTLEVAMDVLRQTHLALVLMFCAGWVHRDISAGNVLAVKKGDRSPWCAKLSDLEYARRFPSDDPGSTDPKTGTPYFMAWEIQTSYSLYMPVIPRTTARYIRSQNRPGLAGVEAKVVKKHTYAHDLESLFWLILWILTNYLGHRESYRLALIYFQDNNVLARKSLLESGMLPIHHPRLSEWVEHLNVVRMVLLGGYANRDPETDIEKVDQYAAECDSFNDFFTSISGEVTRQAMVSLVLCQTDESTPDAAGAGDVAEQDSSPSGSASKKRKIPAVSVRTDTGPFNRSSGTSTTSSAGRADAPGPAKKPRT